MWVRLVYDGRLVVLEVAETGHQIIRGESELAADEEKLFIPAPEPQNEMCIRDRDGRVAVVPQPLEVAFETLCLDEIFAFFGAAACNTCLLYTSRHHDVIEIKSDENLAAR